MVYIKKTSIFPGQINETVKKQLSISLVNVDKNSFLWISSHLLKKSLTENFIFHAVAFANYCMKFVVFNPLSYCFEETIGFDR